ncbi:MAG: hypothetical protein R2784_05560 [Saprospiraceae bacterium]
MSSLGIITILPIGGEGPFMYSIDGGQSFSGAPVFSNLNIGTHAIAS